MLKDSLTKTDSYVKKVNKVINEVKKRGYSDIRADIDDYEKPHELKSQSKNVQFIPDVTARKHDSKAYFEIAQKVEDTNQLVNKWTLLSTLAKMKNGVFEIHVPHGHMKFTKDIVNNYNINAELVKM